MVIGNIKKLIISLSAICIAGVIGFIMYSRSTNSLERQVAAMQNMHVSLEFNNAVMKYNGIDSVYESQNVPKLVVYVDSLSCSSCFMNHLLNYYEVNDSLKNYNASILVVLHPQKSRVSELQTRLDAEKYPFWCILDKEGEFIGKNSGIPDNRLLHTFMLDRDDNILLVGDPTANPKIKGLLYKTL